MPSSTRSRPNSNSLPVDESCQRAAVGLNALRHQRLWRFGGEPEVSFERRLVPDNAVNELQGGKLFNLGKTGVAQAAETPVEPGDLVRRDWRPASRHPDDPGATPQGPELREGPPLKC